MCSMPQYTCSYCNDHGTRKIWFISVFIILYLIFNITSLSFTFYYFYNFYYDGGNDFHHETNQIKKQAVTGFCVIISIMLILTTGVCLKTTSIFIEEHLECAEM